MLDLKVDEQFEVADLQEAERRFFIKLKQINFLFRKTRSYFLKLQIHTRTDSFSPNTSVQ